MTFLLYLSWHFYEASKKILQIWRNYFIFIWYYFSISLLKRTLFKPWHRDVSIKKSPGFDFSEFFQNVIFNTFSRIIGFVVRSVTIIFVFILEILIFIMGIIIFVFWIILPLILIYGLYKSFLIYFNGF